MTKRANQKALAEDGAKGELRRGPRRAARPLEPQLDRLAAALGEALAGTDLAPFYTALRASDVPFLAHRYASEPAGIARASFDVLHRLGGLSPAVGMAVENHLYVTAALATFPRALSPELGERGRALLARIARRRLLVANTNSRVHLDRLGAVGTTASAEGGGYRISGSASFMSLATEGDLVFFLTRIGGTQPAIFVTPLKDQTGIEIGPLLFPTAMVDSDTRRVTFHDVLLPAESLFVVGDERTMPLLLAFQMSWHQTLLAALYLGAAARAIEEVRRFLRTVHGAGDRPLAELDGMVVDVGRLAIHYRGACAFAHRAGEALEAVAGGPVDPAAIENAFDLACAAKYTATGCAEEVVARARRILGARAFLGGHPLERLSQEVIFGPLGGEVHATIERRHGRQTLGETPFPFRPW